jgi:hypothetical protein
MAKESATAAHHHLCILAASNVDTASMRKSDSLYTAQKKKAIGKAAT